MIERPLTTDVLIPLEEQSAKAKRQLMRLMRCFLGKGNLSLYRELGNGVGFPDQVAQEVDRLVLGSVKRNYGLPDRVDPLEFYMQQLRQARRLFENNQQSLPEYARRMELKNEIANLPDNPSRLVWLLSRPPENIDRTLAFEAQREVSVLHISAMLNARTLNMRLRTVISEVDNHFDRTLYEGRLGAGEELYVESVHNNETNEVIGFRQDMAGIETGAHLKRIPFTVRNIPGIGPVYASPRKKDDWAATIKVLSKAEENGGVIKADVQDGIGMMIIPLDHHQSPEEVVNRAILSLQSGPKKIDRIVSENNVDIYRGASPEFKFGDRRIVWFEDRDKKEGREILYPFELSSMNTADYLNSILEVGTKNPDTGFYMGQAYPLYNMRRRLPVYKRLYPETIYHIDFERAVPNRMDQIAGELLDSWRVD